MRKYLVRHNNINKEVKAAIEVNDDAMEATQRHFPHLLFTTQNTSHVAALSAYSFVQSSGGNPKKEKRQEDGSEVRTPVPLPPRTSIKALAPIYEPFHPGKNAPNG